MKKSRAQFCEVIDRHRIILCVGAGGVGKTTTTASIGLYAAQRGKRALCLTIDPARRLAQSLGLDATQADAQRVSPKCFEQAGMRVDGSLTVMMLNTKDTFDELVRRYAANEQVRDAILNNRIYHYVSTALSGTRDYMAIEKLHNVKDDPSYDLIVLDTPPTSHAIDFLEAPERMIDAMNNSAAQWIMRAARATTHLSFDLLARSAAIGLRAMERITGAGFMSQVAELLGYVDDMFGGVERRARHVQQSLRAKDVAYVLVTSPNPAAIEEVLYFAHMLDEIGLKSHAFVVNSVHQGPTKVPSEAALRASFPRGQQLGDSLVHRMLQAIEDEALLAARSKVALRQFEKTLHERYAQAAQVIVPEYSRDVHDLRALQHIVDVMRDGNGAVE